MYFKSLKMYIEKFIAEEDAEDEDADEDLKALSSEWSAFSYLCDT